MPIQGAGENEKAPLVSYQLNKTRFIAPSIEVKLGKQPEASTTRSWNYLTPSPIPRNPPSVLVDCNKPIYHSFVSYTRYVRKVSVLFFVKTCRISMKRACMM